MRMTAARRPEIVVLAALLALAVVAALRSVQPPAAPLASPAAPAARAQGDPRTLEQLQERVRQNPADVEAYAALGHGWLQRVRETGDAGLYAQAEQAFDAALAIDPGQVDALIGRGSLALARHQFAEALAWGERARALAPWRAAAYGVLGDAYVELGRYEEALAAVQQMVDTRPDLASYSRVAYLRELHGEVGPAIEAMELAVDAGAPGAENSVWTRVQLGNLHFGRGDLDRAAEQYRLALAERPGYPYAQAGLARVRAARGDLAGAAQDYARVVERLPLPEFVIALGELYEAQGRRAEAERQYELVRAMQQISAAEGVDVDLELALFDADHGQDPQAALRRARAAYERRPSIYAADTLAWAMLRAGDRAGAARHSAEALRLGTRDATLHYHAGIIAHTRGDAAAARAHLADALAINPHFSPLRAAEARAILQTLP